PATSENEVIGLRHGSVLGPPARGRLLKTGDRVSTGPTTTVLIRFENETAVILLPSTTVVVGFLRDLIGEILVLAHARFQARTDYVTAAVEGTRFSLAARAATAMLSVDRGRVVLTSNQRAWTPIRVGEGESASVYRTAP